MEEITLNLNPTEEKELIEGQWLYEMTQTPGFTVLLQKLENAAFHSWVDPREIVGPDAEREWKWRELNGFYAASNARELIEWIQQSISRSEYLQKKKSGEIKVNPMKIQ